MSDGPVNIGTSVLACKYDGGIMIATDTAISYGSSRATKDACRMAKLGNEGVFACSGEMADFDEMKRLFEEKYEAELVENDGTCFLHPKDYFNWMARHQFQKRTKGQPLWVTMVVGGVNHKTGEQTLAQCDHLGTRLYGDWMATGLAHHYLGAIFSTVWKPNMTEQEARNMLETGMKVMF